MRMIKKRFLLSFMVVLGIFLILNFGLARPSLSESSEAEETYLKDFTVIANAFSELIMESGKAIQQYWDGSLNKVDIMRILNNHKDQASKYLVSLVNLEAPLTFSQTNNRFVTIYAAIFSSYWFIMKSIETENMENYLLSRKLLDIIQRELIETVLEYLELESLR